jgi:hypothetical protein
MQNGKTLLRFQDTESPTLHREVNSGDTATGVTPHEQPGHLVQLD